MEYNFDIIYCSGPENVVTDFLLQMYMLYTTENTDQDNEDRLIAK